MMMWHSIQEPLLKQTLMGYLDLNEINFNLNDQKLTIY